MAYLDSRDLIFFEQRGVLYSKLHLACPEWTQANKNIFTKQLKQDAANVLLSKAVSTFKAGLIASSVDLDGYYTREIAADIEALCCAFTIEKIISYQHLRVQK